MKILLKKTSKVLRNGQVNPKSPPPEWWAELDVLLKDHEVREVPDLVSWQGMKDLLDWCDTWVSVDTYWHHFAWYYGKKGIVIFGITDPLIFGHPENVNLLKDRKYLREEQFAFYEGYAFNPDVFVEPSEVINHL